MGRQRGVEAAGASPRSKRKQDRVGEHAQPRGTPHKATAAGAAASAGAGTSGSPHASPAAPTAQPERGGAASASAADGPHAAADDASGGGWQRCAELLREAVADPGSAAAALVPLRPSLQRVRAELVRLLDEAVTSANGNAAVLVLGPPGSGKTLVVERAIAEVCRRHNEAPASTAAAAAAAASAATPAPTTAAAAAAAAAASAATPAPTTAAAAAAAQPPPLEAAQRTVGVVRLSGLLQPDERSAFQEVARQLCRDFGQRFVKSASFDENLVFLKAMLHALYKCLKKVIFVVDEFEQYARRGKQQMLYYLLDMLQDSRIQAAVVGISCAHNVAEDLEKRVLSRVGRRRLLITFAATAAAPEHGGGAAPAGAAGADVGDMEDEDMADASATAAAAAHDSYGGLLYDMLALHPGMAALGGLGEAAAAAHNAALAAALRNKDVTLPLEKLALLGAPPQHVALAAETALVGWAARLRALGPAAAASGGPAAALGADALAEALRSVTDAPERSLVEAVSGLAVLPLTLLVAAHRLQRKGSAMCNFEMAWDEYRSIQGQRGAIVFGKDAAAAAWQALPLAGLAAYSDAHVEDRGRDLAYAGLSLLVGQSDVAAGVRAHPHCPDAVRRFLECEI